MKKHATLLACALLAATGAHAQTEAPRTVTGLHEVFACTLDGWLVSAKFEVTAEGKAQPHTRALLRTVNKTVREAIANNNHDAITAYVAGPYRAAITNTLDPHISALEKSSGGSLHVGLRDGTYMPTCPVV